MIVRIVQFSLFILNIQSLFLEHITDASKPAMTPPFPYFGEIAAVTASLIWAHSLAIFKYHGSNLASDDLNLFKNCIAIVCLLTTLIFIGFQLPTQPTAIALLVFSGVVGLGIGDTLLLSALGKAGAQLTSALQCLSPLFSAALAAIFWQEHISGRELLGMCIIVAGTMVVIFSSSQTAKATQSSFDPTILRQGILMATGASLCQAIGWVTMRFAFQQTEVYSGTLIRIGAAVAFSLVIKRLFNRPFQFHQRVSGDSPRIRWLVAASLLGSFVGLTLISAATKYSKAGVSSALGSLYPIFIIPVAVVFLKEKMRPLGMAATVVTVAGVILMLV